MIHDLTSLRKKARAARLSLDVLGDGLTEAVAQPQIAELLGLFSAVERSVGDIGQLLRVAEAGSGETPSEEMKSLRSGIESLYQKSPSNPLLLIIGASTPASRSCFTATAPPGGNEQSMIRSGGLSRARIRDTWAVMVRSELRN